jgi:hypothetical protein
VVVVPHQPLVDFEVDSSVKVEGWTVVLHPNFIQRYALAKRIKEYKFFS